MRDELRSATHMNRLQSLLAHFPPLWIGGFAVPRREEGQTLVEYALILVLIAIAVVVILTTLGGNIKGIFSQVSSKL